jgi:endonuclease-8
MDQSVVSGIGNVYRAELLYRALLDPHTPGKMVPEELVRQLWRDWTRLLVIGSRRVR